MEICHTSGRRIRFVLKINKSKDSPTHTICLNFILFIEYTIVKGFGILCSYPTQEKKQWLAREPRWAPTRARRSREAISRRARSMHFCNFNWPLRCGFCFWDGLRRGSDLSGQLRDHFIWNIFFPRIAQITGSFPPRFIVAWSANMMSKRAFLCPYYQ